MTRVLVTGAAGQLGTYLMDALTEAGYEAVGTAHSSNDKGLRELDIADSDRVDELIRRVSPDVVIHAAAYTDVDGCERDPERASAVNHSGALNVARAAASVGAWAIGVGTDFVFGGSGEPPFSESSEPCPMSAYGASKRAGEQAFLEADASFAVARTAWLYGGSGKHFPRTVLNVLDRAGTMEVVVDEIGNPTFAGDLADALVALIPHKPSGIVHLVNEGATSRFELARAVAELAGIAPESVQPTTVVAFLEKYPLPAKRPTNSELQNFRAAELGVRLPPWRDALERYIPTLVREMST